MMLDLEALFRTVDELSSDDLKQLYLYILENHVQFTQKASAQPATSRILGLHGHLGAAWLSDDFHDELPQK
jgi:hypothetical protein